MITSRIASNDPIHLKVLMLPAWGQMKSCFFFFLMESNLRRVPFWIEKSREVLLNLPFTIHFSPATFSSCGVPDTHYLKMSTNFSLKRQIKESNWPFGLWDIPQLHKKTQLTHILAYMCFFPKRDIETWLVYVCHTYQVFIYFSEHFPVSVYWLHTL